MFPSVASGHRGDAMGRHEPFRISRRRALVSLGRLGLLGLSGCCSLRRFPSPQITGDPNPTDDQNPFLRPTVNVNPEKPFKYCIDAHAHFLNASDIDAQGYLKGPVAHGIQPAALREFVRRMAPVVDALA